MKTRYFIPAVAFILLLLPFALTMADPSDSPTPKATQSGIQGVISLSPNRPGPIRIDTPSKGPLAEIEFEVLSGDKVVTSFTTDKEGAFSVMLPEGHYTVKRKNFEQRIGRFGPFEVEVKPSEVTKVEWTCDSGMR